MATALHDVAHTAAFSLTVSPQTITADLTGNAVDMTNTDGPAFVVLSVGEVADGTTVTATLEESTDLAAWTTLASSFPANTGPDAAALVTVNRTKRYVRALVAVDGEDANAVVCVGIGARTKLIG